LTMLTTAFWPRSNCAVTNRFGKGNPVQVEGWRWIATT
jgi:hypothetical protein